MGSCTKRCTEHAQLQRRGDELRKNSSAATSLLALLRCCFHNKLRSVAGTVHGDDIFYRWPAPGYIEIGSDTQVEMEDFRSHFGSRAFSVQVIIVAGSDHVFHRFPFDLLIQVSATQLPLFFVHFFRSLPIAQMKMHCTFHCQDHRRYLQTLVLLMVLAMTLTGCVNARSMHGSKSSETFCYHSRV